MAQASSSVFSEFQLVASEFRRDCADLDARMKRLESLRAETDKLRAESNARLSRALTIAGGAPNLVPEPEPSSELVDQFGPPQK